MVALQNDIVPVEDCLFELSIVRCIVTAQGYICMLYFANQIYMVLAQIPSIFAQNLLRLLAV